MSLSTHVIGTNRGSVPLLEWVANHKYRNYASFDIEKQLEHAKKIAAIEDADSRKLMLDLLDKATYLQTTVEEMHKEMDTLFAALSKIQENESKVKT